eukprot:scaffold583_cov176-Amphora_coffeaeformis.AAC.9
MATSYQHQDVEALILPGKLSIVETTIAEEDEEEDRRDTSCREGRMHVAMIFTLMVGVFFAYVLLS